MSTVTIVIPTFNEEKNIIKSYKRISNLYKTDLERHYFQKINIENA